MWNRTKDRRRKALGVSFKNGGCVGKKFKGFPGMYHGDVPRNQRLRYLQVNSERGIRYFDYDKEDRRKGFESYKYLHLAELTRDKVECYTCRAKAEEWHHIILICHGGWDCERNLVPLCNLCHKKAHRFNRFVHKKITPASTTFVSPLVKPLVSVVFVPKIYPTEKIIPLYSCGFASAGY